VEAQVIIDLPTLLGLADNPGELAGVGPIPAEVARALAADDGATRRRLVVEPVTGALLDYGASVYRSPTAPTAVTWTTWCHSRTGRPRRQLRVLVPGGITG